MGRGLIAGLVSNLFHVPRVVFQALWLKATAPRLPEPDGPREGRVGQGPLLRLLIVGDSSAAGVGVAEQGQALSGQVAACLSASLTVEWRLIARSGATAADTVARLNAAEPGEFDAAIIALGVNDAKNGVPLRRFLANMDGVAAILRSRFGVGTIYVSGLPPVREFPLLPHPLRDVLGTRTEWFDRELSRHVTHWPDTRFLPLDFGLDVAHMSEDGFHPGPPIYASWARHMSALISVDFPGTGAQT